MARRKGRKEGVEMAEGLEGKQTGQEEGCREWTGYSPWKRNDRSG